MKAQPIKTRPVQASAPPPIVPPPGAPPSSNGHGGGGGPKRRDQFQCPACGTWGCRVTNGTHQSMKGLVRYRSCPNGRCTLARGFRTLQPRGGGPERYTP